ncbi:MAG: ABC transporter permease [Thermoanaerobaculia bacterium]
MNFLDSLNYIFENIKNHKLRVTFTVIGVSIGIFLVLIMTSLVEGARIYVLKEFLDLGSNLIIVLPGKVETSGALPWGGITKDLTLEDFQKLRNEFPEFKIGAPIVVSTEKVKYKNRFRSVAILGTTREYSEVRSLKTSSGDFLPSKSAEDLSYLIVLGSKLCQEIFGKEEAMGKIVKLGNFRFKVCGVLKPKGKVLGFDLDDLAFIPVKTSMKIFNKNSLFRIVLKAPENSNIEKEKLKVLNFFKKIHRVEDVTVITQESMLSSFSLIMNMLTLVLFAIGSISLIVAGLTIMNIMLISVSERVQEIGILRSCGALKRQVLSLFLREAIILSSLGGILGLVLSFFSILLFNNFFPSFPIKTPLWALVSALFSAFLVGSISGIFPALKASRVDPITALRKK